MDDRGDRVGSPGRRLGAPEPSLPGGAPGRLALLGALALVVVTALLLTGSLAGGSDPGASGSPALSRRPDTASPSGPALVSPVTRVGPAFDPATVDTPTATKNQRKLWVAHGRWWGVFAIAAGRTRIHRLDPGGWRDTGTLVDDRAGTQADALWVGEHLYIASAGRRDRVGDAGRLMRYSFDATLDRFVIDPDFPVTVTPTGAESLVLERDSTGTLWLAWTKAGRLQMRASTGDDHHWGEVFTPAVADVDADPDDIAGIAAYGPGRIGVLWSNQRIGAFVFASHRDGDPPDVWSPSQRVIEEPSIADDHMSLARDRSGRLYAVVKTSLDAVPNQNPNSPQILLLREDGGTWHTSVVSRLRDGHSRPALAIDVDGGYAYVLATWSGDTSAIHVKRARTDDLLFDVGRGVPFIADDGHPAISNVTTTGQELRAASGLVAIAADAGTGRYLYGSLDLGGGDPGEGAPAPPDAPSAPPGDEPLGPEVLVRDTFAAWRPGDPAPGGWATRGDAARARVVESGADQALAVTSTDGTLVRACRDLRIPEGRRFGVRMRVRATGAADGDVRLVSIRGPGYYVLEVRVTPDGRIEERSAGGPVDAGAALPPGRWYEVRVSVTGDGTTTWNVRDASNDRVLASGRERPPAQPIGRPLESACAGPATGTPGATIEIDDLSATLPVP